MAIETTLMYDAIGANVPHLPIGQHAGYSTGEGAVPWTAGQFAASPDAVQIDQTPVNTPADERADVLDYESGAATLADIAPWARAAEASYHAAARPGQRFPAVYFSATDIHDVANALAVGKVSPGVGLAVANWELDQGQATAMVAGGWGPWPVVWVQFGTRGGYDIGVASVPWLSTRSAPPATAFHMTAAPPGWWKAGTELTCTGTGTDGQPYTTTARTGLAWSPAAKLLR